MNFLSQRGAIDALNRGYVLESTEATIVFMRKGKQSKSNKKRKGFSGNYVFSSRSTWRIVGRISLWRRLQNSFYTVFVNNVVYEKKLKAYKDKL